MPALISYVDRNLKYQFVNETYSEWFHKPSEELVGKSVREVLGIRAFREVKSHIEEALSGQNVSYETTLYYKNAGKRFVHVSYVPDI